jgi:Lipoprotein LpqB beta-propeller domain/Sporulation and spore germination
MTWMTGMTWSRGRSRAAGWLPRMGTRGRAAAAAAAVGLAVAGCATVPTSGAVQQVGASQPGLSQEQEYSQPIPVGPGPGWTPTQIVSGFLAASASFAHDHQVAKEYLDSTAEQSWQPGWAVTVVNKPPTITPVGPLPRLVHNQSQWLARVKVTGVPVATITGLGQYQVYSGSPSSESYYFFLRRINRQWRIDSLPTSQGLLLSEADFQRVYQPRDLYFLSQSGHTLVPDPVFVPQQATDTDLATGLVNALLQDPTGWLSGAAVTGFPAHSQPIGQVRINGPNATVDLGGPRGKAVTADPQRLEQMAAQLVWTLASGPTPVQSVELELNNRPVQIMGRIYQLPQTYSGWVPSQVAGASLYFVGSSGTVQALSGAGQPGAEQPGRVSAVPGAAGSAGVPALTSIAVSPDGRSLAGIAAGGAAVYITGLSHGATLREWRPTNGSCTSVSWDAQDDLWITAGGIVWMLPPGGGSATPVTVDVPTGSNVTDFQVAPDGVRVAMIVHGSSGSQVQVGAIIHSGTSSAVLQAPVTIGAGISQPDALSWYGSDDLIVLAGSPASAQLDEVPLNGGQFTAIPAPGSPQTVTAARSEGGASDIVVGLPGGKIMLSTDMGEFQPVRAAGQAPVYPG